MLCDTDALNAGRVVGVVWRMVDGIVHARNLAKLAWLSTASFRPTPQVPLFQKDNMDPSQVLPAHHTAPVGEVIRQQALARVQTVQPLRPGDGEGL